MPYSEILIKPMREDLTQLGRLYVLNLPARPESPGESP